MRPTPLLVLALAGCQYARDASTIVNATANGATGPGTNSAGRITGLTVSPHEAATLPTHPAAVAILILAAVALVGSIIWLIHNRGKLIGLATKITGV